jgi:hypothetical protein
METLHLITGSEKHGGSCRIVGDHIVSDMEHRVKPY